MAQYQLDLSFLEAWETPRRDEELVRQRVAACAQYLQGLSLKPAPIAAILIHPDRHWRRIIPSRNGKPRVCYSPSEALRKIQRRIVRNLRRICYGLTAPGFPATAFERNCSIVANARYHRRNRSSWCLDLHRAFEQVRVKHVFRALLRLRFQQMRHWTPEGRYDDTVHDFTRPTAWVFSRLLTYRGRLPRGAPSSPFLFNLLTERLDSAIAQSVGAPTTLTALRGEPAWLEELENTPPHEGIVYTRYGDDLCFSAPSDKFPVEAKQQVLAVLAQHHLRVNDRKTREGRNGVLLFPGVVVVRGRIRPTGAYVAKLARLIAVGTFKKRMRLVDDIRPLLGHRMFLRQFGQGGRLRFIRDNLPRITL